jgi:ATP-dependent RNA helicase SUPV3L1/SUV3
LGDSLLRIEPKVVPDLSTPIASRLNAVLGPTNTGKTHRAIERMLEFDTGMMGFPLRLLAREVYDRITQRLGEERVALVTGEEKRIPRRPSYWVCTVEAMPVQLEVDFVAIDEIQLIAHPTRGHVFTQRLLETRGIKETWFLGSDTARPLLERLVPTATFERLPRLSRLSFSGAHALNKLPRRSAVVAFSHQQVYELAERLRRKGGAAVVLGALSPRTRNAQVAMYQAGEVEYVVATDAIGMGLNLALDHVAFASLSKFDGVEARQLHAWELGQIAGRAGRHTNDGSFGTLRDGPPLPEPIARAIESHRFEPLRIAAWRNSELDFSTLPALLDSLNRAPRNAVLRRFDQAADALALRLLAKRPWVQKACSTAPRVALLWTVCQLPDYRKLLPEVHAELLGEIFGELLERGSLSDTWLSRKANALGDTDGDLDTLIGRIASVRTLSYLCQQPGFVGARSSWQERTRAIEDRLSDALHERLVQRFVERTHRRNVLLGKDTPFAKLAASRLALPTPIDWVQRAIDAPFRELDVDSEGVIRHGEHELGKLVAGKALLFPDVRLLALEAGDGQKTQLLRRLGAYARDLITHFKDGWHQVNGSGIDRGLCYQLLEGLGSLELESVGQLLATLDSGERAVLEGRGIHFGRRFVWVGKLLRPRALSLRRALVRVFTGVALPPTDRARVSIPRPTNKSPKLALLTGYVEAGPRWVRCDMVERALAASDEPGQDRTALIELLACKKSELEAILRALGLTQTRNEGSEGAPRRIRRNHQASPKRP